MTQCLGGSLVRTSSDAPAGQRDDIVNDLLEEGRRYHQTGELARAQVLFDRILAIEPDHADSLHLLGVIAHQTGSPAQAESLFRRALDHAPQVARYHCDLGNTLRVLGRHADAIAHFRIALRLRPGSPEVHCNLGNALRDGGDLDGAAAHYRTALCLAPLLADAHYNLANVLCDLGQPARAEARYREALRLRPDYADAYYNLGNALIRLCRPKEAESAFREALWLRADHPDTLNNLGVALQEQGRLAEAKVCYRAALCVRPDFPEAHYNLGCACLADGRGDEAAQCYRQALALKPDYGAARFGLSVAELPILYTDENDIARSRQAYESSLRRLNEEFEQGNAVDGLAEGVGATQPFFLAYQGRNDRDLQDLYGSLICRIMAQAYPPAPLAPAPAAGERIRVGIVSGFFCDHTIWHLFLSSWLRHIDRGRFEVYGYHTGMRRDHLTDQARALCDRFTEGRRSGAHWRERIIEDAPHILLYPEIGMDAQATQLAAQRLAMVQCNCWGHPTTSGLPTIDHFLSSALMEPDGADDCYTENLIRLPNLATCYEPESYPETVPDRAALGLRPDAVVYWSGQALFKYLPRYDRVLASIAVDAANCQFVFIEFANSAEVTAAFRKRLDASFAAFGLRAADYCIMLPPLTQDKFIAAVRHSDVILDTIGWSGGRSTLDCLAHDAPIVTLKGASMRGRHTAAILRMIGVTDTIADTIDDYVALAVRLARDVGWRATIQTLMRENRHRAFGDRSCILALEEFMVQAVRCGDSASA